MKKIGIMICGVVFVGGVVFGVDIWFMNGEIVVDKNCEKIYYIVLNIYCCGVGIVVDMEFLIGKSCNVVGLFEILF